MLRAPAKLLPTVSAVTFIAFHGAGAPVRSATLTERQGISPRFLETVLQQLVRDGILRGTRGPRGGYTLGRDAGQISLLDIATSVAQIGDDPEVPADTSELSAKVVLPIWQELLASWTEQLATVTVAELCRRARLAGLSSDNERPPDYTI